MFACVTPVPVGARSALVSVEVKVAPTLIVAPPVKFWLVPTSVLNAALALVLLFTGPKIVVVTAFPVTASGMTAATLADVLKVPPAKLK